MKWNLKRDKYKGYNVYSMKKYVDKKRIIFLSLTIILIIFTLLLIGFYSFNTISILKNIQEQDEKLIAIYNEFKKQEEENESKSKICEENKPAEGFFLLSVFLILLMRPS